MTLASAVDAAFSGKHFSLSPLRLRPRKPHLLSPHTSTAALLSGRRYWNDGDGDGVVKSLRFCRSATALAGGAVMHDAGATAVVMAGAYGLVLTFDVLTQRNLMEQYTICGTPETVKYPYNSSAEFEQKIGPHIVWVAFHDLLANIQDALLLLSPWILPVGLDSDNGKSCSYFFGGDFCGVPIHYEDSR